MTNNQLSIANNQLSIANNQLEQIAGNLLTFSFLS